MSRFVLTAQLQLQAPNNVAQVVRQIQSQLNNVNVNVQVQGTAQAQRQLQQVTAQTNAASTAADRMGRAFAVSIRRFAAFSIATRAVGLFTSTLADAVKTAIDFERQMIKVSQVTGDSMEKLKGLTRTITELSTSLGVPSQGLLEVSTLLLQAGVSAKDTEVALKTLAKAALAPNFDSITETAEGAIAILAQFGQGVGALEAQLGSINAVAGAFAVEAGDLIDVIRRTGGVFKSSGGNLNELLALFTSVRATTRESAESIGTGLRTIFTRIQRPKTIEFLKQFGVELVDLEGKFVGPFEAVRRLSEALAGLGEGDITFIRIAEELGGFRQIGKVLPLLQQFSTAQQALNVANKAGNSLTTDAITAQQALAVRITKVKEEFLALVRGMTETKTFQIMANTALAFASALIKIGEAIKPLLPLLAAVAAVNLAKGLGTFAGGMMRGMQSGRTFSQGGKVHKFARGGLVPGKGNRDTVPAMLMPGEFVIKKSSVNQLGVNNLAAMNENRYASGGKLETMSTAKSAILGKRRLTPMEMQKAAKRAGYDIERRDDGLIELSRNGRTMHVLTDDQASKLLGSMMTGYAIGGIVGGVGLTPSDQNYKGSGKVSIKNIIESLIKNSNLPGGISGNKDVFLGKESSKIAQEVISRVGGFSGSSPSSSRNFTAIGQSFKDADLNRQIGDDVEAGMKNLILNAASVLGGSIGVGLSGSPNQALIKSIGSADVMGKIFEGALNLLGAPFDTLSAKQDRDSFDFPSGLGGALGSYFKGFANIPVDAKKNLNVDILNDIASRKTKNLIAGQVNLDAQFQQLKNAKLAARSPTRKKLATGGGVGTDTVPALLTPGEFVINRSSAQKIGYGNLNRMNKVGRYATGGIVQRFQNGSTGPVTATPARSSSNPSTVAYVSVQSLTQNAQAIKASTQAIQQNTQTQTQSTKSIKDVISNNKMFAASMTTSLISGFLPAVDENSGALLKLSHSFLGLITTITSVGFALEAFGAKLTAKGLMDLAGGKGLGMRQLAGLRSTLTSSGLSKGLSTQITGAVQGFAKLAGPLAAVAGGALFAQSAFNTVAESINNFDGKLKKSIDKGNVEEAGRIASDKAKFDKGIGAAGGVAAATAAGAAIGSFIPVIGTAVGALAGFGIGLLGIIPNFTTTTNSAKALAEAQAGAVRTQKALDEAQKTATNAMEDFRNGAISASEALSRIRAATSEAETQQKRAENFATENVQNRSIGSGAILRNLGAYLGGGLFGMETAATRNDRLSKETAEQLKQAAKFAADAFQMQSEARQATIRSGVARGKSASEVETEALGGLREKRTRQEKLAMTLLQKGDNEGFEAAKEAANQTAEQIRQVEREIANITKEVERAKALFEAMNLGLRGATATATAMSASMNKFSSGLEVGGNMFVANVEFLSQAVSGAAQAMDPAEIKSAITDVKQSLESMGVSPQYAAKFEANANAFVQAQQNYNKAFENIKNRISEADFQNMDADSLKKAFAEELTVGLGDEAKKNLSAIINGMQLSDAEVDQIIGGNLEIFGDKLGEAGQKQFETIMKIAQERQKAEQILIGFIQKRIEAERNFAEAQKEAIDLLMEGREVQGKYGGRAVSQDERRSAIIARANANRAGIPNLRTGSVAELRARNAQIGARFFGVEQNRRVEGGMQGARGVEQDATQQDLIKAQKDQVQTIRDMIKLEEESLRIIQEKNKLEKDAMNSLITGDIEKFFEQQSAVGAQAAIAAGDTELANMFGAKAVGDAFLDITRQMEAGVQELFGRQLAGPGGLAEQAAGAALASRGVMDPRMAQMMAGTTPEEQAIKDRLQQLGGLLGETGAWMQAMSEMQVQTAQINVANAEIKMSQIEQRGREAAAQMNRGGVVYANRGIFVPRGSDTVPAMLTPGEFVVRREAVNRGNNLQLLKAMNNSGKSPGYARGGKVGYYANGGQVGSDSLNTLLQNAANVLGINTELINNLANTFNTFNNRFAESIQNLQNTRLNVSLDSVNVNVNINGGFLSKLSGDIQKEVMTKVVNEIKNNYRIGNNGNIVEKTGNLPQPAQGS